jgi:hypothetical protein
VRGQRHGPTTFPGKQTRLPEADLDVVTKRNIPAPTKDRIPVQYFTELQYKYYYAEPQIASVHFINIHRVENDFPIKVTDWKKFLR